MGFFAALFGGAVLAGKSLVDSYRKESAEERWNKYRCINRKVTNSVLESQIHQQMCDSKEGRIQMLDEIEDELEEIFGSNWRAFYRYYIFNWSRGYDDNRNLIFTGYINPENEYFLAGYEGTFSEVMVSEIGGFLNIWNLACEVWMSKKGFIACGRNKYNTMFGIRGCGDAERKAVATKACQIIERNLQNAHPDMNLRLRLDYSEFGKNGMPKLAWEHWLYAWELDTSLKPW